MLLLLVKLLFNRGYLKLKTALRMHNRGYSIICRNGRVEHIQKV